MSDHTEPAAADPVGGEPTGGLAATDEATHQATPAPTSTSADTTSAGTSPDESTGAAAPAEASPGTSVPDPLSGALGGMIAQQVAVIADLHRQLKELGLRLPAPSQAMTRTGLPTDPAPTDAVRADDPDTPDALGRA